MYEFIRFGLIDNGILISLGLLGVSLEQPIEKGINWMLQKTSFNISIKSPARFGLFVGGVGNAISDFFGGLGISFSAAIGTFVGCAVIVIFAIPFTFRIDKKLI